MGCASAGLWVVPWPEKNSSKLSPSLPMRVCGLCCGFVIFLFTLTDLQWVCDLWCGFVFCGGCGCAGLWWVAYCKRWWAFCCWWWVIGMGLMIRGFGGSALLRWQWSDPMLFLVARCLIRWVFVWILWAPLLASWLMKQRGVEGERERERQKEKEKIFFF